MNTHPGVFGKKLGMTQIFNDDGSVTACTVVESKPVVVGKRTQAKDGYDALILGIGERTEKHTPKPLAGFYKAAGVALQGEIKELRCTADHAAKFEVGQTIKLDEIFAPGQMVDVQAVTRGRGFTGVVRRYGFAGSGASHGAHEYKRHGGSIGMNMTPGKVLKGQKMAGQLGNVRRSILNQRVVKVLADESLLLVRGGVPGPRNGTVVVRGAVKRFGGRQSSE